MRKRVGFLVKRREENKKGYPKKGFLQEFILVWKKKWRAAPRNVEHNLFSKESFKFHVVNCKSIHSMTTQTPHGISAQQKTWLQ